MMHDNQNVCQLITAAVILALPQQINYYSMEISY